MGFFIPIHSQKIFIEIISLHILIVNIQKKRNHLENLILGFPAGEVNEASEINISAVWWNFIFIFNKEIKVYISNFGDKFEFDFESINRSSVGTTVTSIRYCILKIAA